MELNTTSNEAFDIYKRCKCCLDDVNLLDMWEEAYNDGQVEVYGNMLLECFKLDTFVKTEKDCICSSCVDRLRSALYFKREVDASLQVLSEVEKNVTSDNKVEIKVELADYEAQEMLDDNIWNDESFEVKKESDVYIKEENSCNSEENINFASNENLDDVESDETEDVSLKPKSPITLCIRNRVDRKYTAEDLHNAVVAVQSKRMGMSDASRTYNIPLTTMKTYVKKYDPLAPVQEFSVEFKLTKEKSLIEDIKTLLASTNIIPFKSKSCRFSCPYCKGNATFQDMTELRIHMSKHNNERIKRVEEFMTPAWMNEILKVEVRNLTCTICNTKLKEWNDMFIHLSEHDIIFEEAHLKVIPFDTTTPLKCFLCKEAFANFHLLDGHMNGHYNNFICPHCGDSFLSNGRLDKHMELHNKGQYPCEFCGKVFSLQKYRVKHLKNVHRPVYKCTLCSDMFKTNSERHDHNLQKHHLGRKVYTCEYCGQRFGVRAYFLRHLKRCH